MSGSTAATNERDLGSLHAGVDALNGRMQRHETLADASFTAIRASQTEMRKSQDDLVEAVHRIELQLASGAGGRGAVNYMAHALAMAISAGAAVIALFHVR